MLYHLTNLLRPLYYLASELPGYVPLALLPLAALVAGAAWRAGMAGTGPARGWPRLAGGMILAFGLLDAALLGARPFLGVSYGPSGLTLLLFVAMRALLALGVLLVAVGWRRFRLRAEAALLNPRAGSWPAVMLAALNLAVLACFVDGFYLEPFALQTTSHSLPGPGLAGRPLRIVHLSDLHVERLTRRERELVARVQALHPDLIVLTGDYLNLSYLYDPQAQADVRWVFSQLSATYGVYAVSGSQAVDPPAALEALFGEGFPAHSVIRLEDEARRISLPQGDLSLIGLTLHEEGGDGETLARLVSQLPPDAYRILLYHTSALAGVADERGIDLYLAGHTHGGQIRLPWYGAVFTSIASGKQYEAGLYALGNGTNLYVNRGLGMEGRGAPRARFLCPPEIAVFDLSLLQR